ncbi:MAG TPA: putative solute-binding protein [Aquabacterium sp.]|uniref:putative solute-binding protein n=1 Tax=Aquabacterium sp. TaxID=1872578 RepID=UPI002E340BAA|nr:putative solute-binding protein [Aquabacterium sp.]HEX5357362.1 putative solute-binding protein [Aquabacterium sp.]
MTFQAIAGKAGAALALTAVALSAQAANTMCVFDIIGASGDAFNMAKDYAVAMQKTGVTVELKGFTNETAAVEEFRAGKCDALMATAFRTRQFNGVAGSIDTLGATTVVRDGKVDMPASYEVVRKVVQTFSSPQAAKMMVEGAYEIGGIVPFGAAYPMVNNRAIDSVEALAGKKIAALEYDQAQAMMVQRVGGKPVAVDINNLSAKFNGGEVDMIAAPTLAYKPLELSKGIGAKGGIARFPLLILTYQVVLNQSKFPAGFGEKSREHWVGEFDRAMKLVQNADASIPAATWMEVSPDHVKKYTSILRESRIAITNQGVYNKQGLKVIKKVRCAASPTEADCASPSEEG